MLYERKRKEILTTTTEVSRKREGDWYNNAQTINDTRINVEVYIGGSVFCYNTLLTTAE